MGPQVSCQYEALGVLAAILEGLHAANTSKEGLRVCKSNPTRYSSLA